MDVTGWQTLILKISNKQIAKTHRKMCKVYRDSLLTESVYQKFHSGDFRLGIRVTLDVQ